MSEAEEQIVASIAERIAARVAADMRGIVPDRVYPADEAAELIGYRGARGGKTLRDVPAELLPQTPIGPNGGRVGYRGRDLLAYLDAIRKAG